jgi:hypothetical protein
MALLSRPLDKSYVSPGKEGPRIYLWFNQTKLDDSCNGDVVTSTRSSSSAPFFLSGRAPYSRSAAGSRSRCKGRVTDYYRVSTNIGRDPIHIYIRPASNDVPIYALNLGD